jgi:glucose/arabinose dehydrogenase
MTKAKRPTTRAVMLTLLAAIVAAAPSAAQTLNDPALRVDPIAGGLAEPTGMVFIGSNDLLVIQKADGRVRRVIGGVVQGGQVLDLAVDSFSERGLLGIALHPGFPGVPFVYLYYTASGTSGDTTMGSPTPVANRVSRYTWNGSALVSPALIVNLPVTPGPNHDGGILRFGPDGKLYIVIGELNRSGQLQNISGGAPPDDTGVILRLNDDGTVPPDNPFAALGGNLAKYYAYGIRNSFGMAFDPLTNKLWMTENGPNLYDEINLVEPGFNSGWNQLMGPDVRDPQGIGNLVQFPGSHYADPKFSWFDTVAPTAIAFQSSGALGAAYTNHVFVGDNNNGRLYHFVPNGTRNGFVFTGAGLGDLVADDPGELLETVIGTGFGAITDLDVGPDGRLYVLSYFGSISVIWRPAAATTLTVTPGSAAPGATVTATWNGIAAPSATDWIGLFAQGAPDTSYISWMYVSCSQSPTTPRASGSCPFVLPSGLATGTYELRLLANNGFTRLATSGPLSVAPAGPQLSVSPGSVAAGGTVTATWSGIASPTATDWIGLFSVGAPDTSYISWEYVSCSQSPATPRASGSCPFVVPSGLAPGNYQLRLLANNGFTRLATSGLLTVTPPGPQLGVSPGSVARGGTVTATWSGITTPSATDWIGLFSPGAPNTAYLAWIYVSCSQSPATPRASGSCPFVIPGGLATGTYQLRLLANDGYTALATSGPLNVTP